MASSITNPHGSPRVFKSLCKCFFLNSVQFKRCLASADARPEVKHEELPRVHVYRRMFPWKTLTQFVDTLEKNIIYRDSTLLAIDKPWGVGIHTASVNIKTKNRYLLLSEFIGDSKYCIDDALEPLAERLNVGALQVIKSTDRHMSGVTLIGIDPNIGQTKAKIDKALRRVKPHSETHSTYWCITKGYPLLEGATLKEDVGIKLVEIDEFGDYKEPDIVFNASKTSYRKKKVISATVDTRIVKTNKDLATALVEVSTDTNRWQFVRLYIATKTSFILGDVRFAARIRSIMGTPMKISAKNMFANDSYEPLPEKVGNRLLVEKNRRIPLMLHQKSLLLPKFNQGKDLLIETNQLPAHFKWTLERLNLLP